MPVSAEIRTALQGSQAIRRIFEEGLELKKQFDVVFDFSLGNPDVPPPPAFKEALAALAAEDGLHGYMPNAGFADVRNAIALKVSRDHGVELPGSHIVMSVGAAGALNVVLKAILDRGSEVIVPVPAFSEYRGFIANHGGKMVSAALTAGFGLDCEAIARALSDVTAAVLINSPHNPTGTVYPRADIAALAGILEAHGRKTGVFPYLIADEPYRDIVYDGLEVAPVLAMYRNAVVVTSYSKNLSLPGERIGYIAAGPDLAEAPLFVSALSYATRTLGFVNAPALMQRCVARLADAKVDIGIYEKRRAAFMETLDAAGIQYVRPQGAFYVFAKVPPSRSNGDDERFAAHLKKERILGVPGSAFGAPLWIRFAYCVDETLIRGAEGGFTRAAASWRDL